MRVRKKETMTKHKTKISHSKLHKILRCRKAFSFFLLCLRLPNISFFLSVDRATHGKEEKAAITKSWYQTRKILFQALIHTRARVISSSECLKQ